MARAARKKCESGYYHVIMRGTDRQNIFEDNEDRYRFLDTLKRYKAEMGFEIHSYCLMGNHVHLLVKDIKDELDLIMKKIAVSYAYYFNQKYDRVGHLFQDRYKSEPVEDDEYFLTVVRYILQNPQKAGISRSDKYMWSSYREYIAKPYLTDNTFTLELLGGVAQFKEYVDEEEKQECLEMDERRRVTDDKAKEILKSSCGISSFSELSKLGIKNRNNIIRTLKDKGLSVRQISRLTGINRGVVQKA